MTRGTCPECGRWLQVNKNGEIARKHHNFAELRGVVVYANGWCAGGKAISDIYESSLPQSLDELLEANRKAVAEREEAF